MVQISDAVGPDCKNARGDVYTVQGLLNQNLGSMPSIKRLVEDGWYGPKTGGAIHAFQFNVLGSPAASGIVEPWSMTLMNLSFMASYNPVPEPPEAVPPMIARDSGIRDYISAARALDCEAAAVEAVAITETHRAAFDSQGRPTILFERHKFYKYTNGAHAATHPDLCNAVAGGYGSTSSQYDRLERAKALNEEAALKSASWGKFQIMGFNHSPAGYATVYIMVEAMKRSEQDHFEAFVKFVKADDRLLRAIRQKDWATFALVYNGENYADNQYDTKMKRHYEAALARNSEL